MPVQCLRFVVAQESTVKHAYSVPSGPEGRRNRIGSALDDTRMIMIMVLNNCGPGSQIIGTIATGLHASHGINQPGCYAIMQPRFMALL